MVPLLPNSSQLKLVTRNTSNPVSPVFYLDNSRGLSNFKLGKDQLGWRRVNTDGVMVGEKVGEVGPKAQVRKPPKEKSPAALSAGKKEGRWKGDNALGRGVRRGLSVGLYFPSERQKAMPVEGEVEVGLGKELLRVRKLRDGLQ